MSDPDLPTRNLPRSPVLAASPFLKELAAWGPDSTAAAPSEVEAEAYCRRLACTHYENFPVVSWLMPRRLRQPLYNVYAYCRWSDDLGDEVGDPARSVDLLRWWRGELDACFAGRVRHPVFVALRKTIREHQLTSEPFEDLLSAFVQDQTVTRYDTFVQLLDYCRRSANPVGRLVLAVMGRLQPENLAWSDSLCTGLQLANFWQDVARDFDIGRVYLPAEDRAAFGYSDEAMHRRETNAAFLGLMEFEVQRARLYLMPWKNIRPHPLRGFPFRLQVDLELFAAGGLAILDEIAAIGYRTWETRPTVSRSRLVRLLLSAICRVTMRTLRLS